MVVDTVIRNAKIVMPEGILDAGIAVDEGRLVPIVDLDKTTELRKDDLVGYGDFSLWEGWRLVYPVTTLSHGEVVVENGKVVGKPGVGKYLKRIPRMGR